VNAPDDFFNIPQHALFLPLDGITSMLELGNKKTATGIVYKQVFEAMGIRHVSVDWNGEDGALKLDLAAPLALGRFDMVTNLGTSEHVDRQEPVWRNMVEACARVLVCSTPLPGDWPKHGMFYPTLEFYEQLAAMNEFVIERLRIMASSPRRLIQARLRRVGEIPFSMPDAALLHRNFPRRKQGGPSRTKKH
jgi:hypothetical protein